MMYLYPHLPYVNPLFMAFASSPCDSTWHVKIRKLKIFLHPVFPSLSYYISKNITDLNVFMDF